MKRITITLTEDQLETISFVLEFERERNWTDDKQYAHFCHRTAMKIRKALAKS